MAKAFYILCAAYLLSSVTAMAQTDHQLIRRIAVFPIKSSEALGNVADDAWWELREVLTKDKRFLVASKNFLMQKDVYQSRGLLSPADAIILGKLLDANVLISTFVEDRTLTMKVYEGEYGRLLWEKQFSLQPSLPVSQQLKSSVVKLAQDFVSSIPYHGYVIVDSLKNRPVYQEGHRLLVKAEVGLNAEIDLGDSVQLVRVFSENLKPLFTNGASIEVFAEGRVVERDRSVILIELDRLNRAAQIQDGTLVRLPREMKRLEQQLAARDSLTGKIDPAFLSPGMTSAKQEVQEKRPLVAALTFILNIAGFLLIAF